jgi:hypothetical protein
LNPGDRSPDTIVHYTNADVIWRNESHSFPRSELSKLVLVEVHRVLTPPASCGAWFLACVPVLVRVLIEDLIYIGGEVRVAIYEKDLRKAAIM